MKTLGLFMLFFFPMGNPLSGESIFFWGGRVVLKQIQEAPLLATEMLQVAEIVGQLVLNTAWGLCKDAYPLVN